MAPVQRAQRGAAATGSSAAPSSAEPAGGAGPIADSARPSLESLFGGQRPQARRPLLGADQAHLSGESAIHAAARRGVASPSSGFPHADVIQRLFGRHDISTIQAHVGAEASASARDMGARAYANGDHVVFDGAPDLYTAAHEAAHVVQQRAGVALKGGVGEAGDRHEQHADAVASLVVAGKSAEPLLDRYAGSTSTGSATVGVQHRMSFAGYGDNHAYLIGMLVRHAFDKHRKEIRMHHRNADAVLAAIAAPFDMPHQIETMMKASKDFGDYDLDNLDDLKRLFDVLEPRVPWRRHVAGTTRGRLRDGARAQLKDDDSRVPLTEHESSRGGYAQLPILEKWHRSDKSNGRLKHFHGQQRREHCYSVRDGKLVSVVDDRSVLTTKTQTVMHAWDQSQAMEDIMEAEHIDAEALDNEGWAQLGEKVNALGAMMIYVMNTQGEIFVAKEDPNVLHHSSFLAGGAVAAAGAIRTTIDGTINFISNKSGHYHPSPAHLWQVLRHLRRHGVDLAGVRLSVLGMKHIFESALRFYQAFDPSKDPRYFDNKWGVEKLDEYLESRHH